MSSTVTFSNITWKQNVCGKVLTVNVIQIFYRLYIPKAFKTYYVTLPKTVLFQNNIIHRTNYCHMFFTI